VSDPRNHEAAIEDPSSLSDDCMHVIEAAIATLRVRAFHDVDLETVAADSGIPLAAVTEQFATWEDLVVATVTVWNGRRLAPILPVAERVGAAAFLRSIIVANVADPALLRLLSAMVNVAATPGHPIAPVLQRQWVQFHAIVQRALMQDVALGREPAGMDAARGAEQLIALYEGLQIQGMMRPTMDVLEAYERAVARLREGWSNDRASLVWEI
jgi:AcrR family transcriptional regulator